jgi:predicted DNA-binding transcriptional regulator AlpA
MNQIVALAEAWKEEALRLRERYGMEPQARICDTHAAELLEAVNRSRFEILTVAEAAAECGYSVPHIRTMIRAGEIPNVGRLGAPRVLREDLPQVRRRASRTGDSGSTAAARGATRRPKTHARTFDPAAAARGIAGS